MPIEIDLEKAMPVAFAALPHVVDGMGPAIEHTIHVDTAEEGETGFLPTGSADSPSGMMHTAAHSAAKAIGQGHTPPAPRGGHYDRLGAKQRPRRTKAPPARPAPETSRFIHPGMAKDEFMRDVGDRASEAASQLLHQALVGAEKAS